MNFEVVIENILKEVEMFFNKMLRTYFKITSTQKKIYIYLNFKSYSLRYLLHSIFLFQIITFLLFYKFTNI